MSENVTVYVKDFLLFSGKKRMKKENGDKELFWYILWEQLYSMRDGDIAIVTFLRLGTIFVLLNIQE